MSTQHKVTEEIYTHEYLWCSAMAISNRLGLDEDNHHLLLPALLTTYLAYEAFINFCGFALRPDLWAEEKKNFKGKTLEQKVEIIADKLPTFKWHKGKRPYQTIHNLSKFRDIVAHGMVQTNEYVTAPKEHGTHFTFKHAWDNYLSPQEVKRFQSDTKRFCESILVAARQVSDHPHLIFEAFEGSLGSGMSNSNVS